MNDATDIDDPFAPRHIQQEFSLCQRYFETSQLRIGHDGVLGGDAIGVRSQVPFVTTKRAVPTITITGTAHSNVANLTPEDVTHVRAGFGWQWLNGTIITARQMAINFTAEAEL